MIKFSINDSKYESDIMELVRLFDATVNEEFSVDVKYAVNEAGLSVDIYSDKLAGFCKRFFYPIGDGDELERKRQEKRYLKMSVYRALNFLTGIRLPYGCLTGIRPTKLYAEIQSKRDAYGKSAREVFVEDYDVSPAKVELVERTLKGQEGHRNLKEEYDVFVFIPFCPSRCAYCSFVSLPLSRQLKLVQPYIDCLLRELEQVREIVSSRGLPIRAVYVGGGTPTSIGAENLGRVLDMCKFEGAKEFTVEAGRPDTLDKAMIEMLKAKGVTRVSINPQSFNQATLDIIGRRHSVSDIYAAYALAKGKFDINMDLIAMLPNESLEDFKRSVDRAVALAPENITVHTLYLKKGSALKVGGYVCDDVLLASQMVDYAYAKLTSAGYEPYYMYRQKYTSGNLENVGYAKAGKQCLYNIDIMEEDTSILACGANAISKKWEKDKNLITRCANYKEPLEYVKCIDSMLKRQADFWK